ncbi:MAG TPA: hypothetical protein VKQ11_00700 [Candidatus Sulfotelmatobacter sp.]|nr:hypothetical protein [Candidatus Sulfotelmatobacter sp.]
MNSTLIGHDTVTAILSGAIRIRPLAGAIEITSQDTRLLIPGDKILDVETLAPEPLRFPANREDGGWL